LRTALVCEAVALVLGLLAARPALYAAGKTTIVSLEEALAAAEHSGPDARLSRVNLATSESQLAQARAQNGLGLSGTAGITRTMPNPGLGAPSLPVSPIDTLQAGIQLTAPLSTRIGISAGSGLPGASSSGSLGSVTLSGSSTLWDGYPGGRARAAVKQAEIALHGAQVSDEASLKSLAYRVKQAYYSMLSAQRELAVLEDTLAIRQQELARTQGQFDRGEVTRIDVQQAQINERAAELDLQAARDSISIARERLSGLAGWPLDRQYEAAEAPDLSVPDLDAAAAVRTALARRADLRQLELSRASGELTLALRQSQAWPTVSASGSFSVDHDWPSGGSATDWSAGLEVSVPILDSGLTANQVQEAGLRNQALDIQRAQLADWIATEVRNDIFVVQDLGARAELASKSLALAQDQYELAQTQADMGVLSTLDLLDASVTLTTARVNLARSRSDAQLAVLALQDAMGE
jgi:outer membrane protein